MDLDFEFDSSQEVERMLYDKTVALVGGSDNWNQPEAEKANIIVRANLNYQRQGGRVDALYTRVEPELSADLKFVAFDLVPEWAPGMQLKLTDLWIPGICFHAEEFRHDWVNPYGPQFEWCNRLCKEIGGMPFTGIIAIEHLTRLPIKSLYLTGFDFYRKANGSLEPQRSSHYIKPHVRWLRQKVDMDRRIIPDDALQEVLAL